MKTLLALFALGAAGISQEPPALPKPGKEHEWLKIFEGNWTTDGECAGEPGKPPLKMKGSASGKSLGGFWAVLENRGEAFGTPFVGLLTLGYDPEKKKYVGTWIDSMTSVHWRYEGSVDASGKVLTLDTQGPNHKTGKLEKFQEKVEIKDKDTWIFTSSMNEDGKWTQFMKMTYSRKIS